MLQDSQRTADCAMFYKGVHQSLIKVTEKGVAWIKQTEQTQNS